VITEGLRRFAVKTKTSAEREGQRENLADPQDPHLGFEDGPWRAQSQGFANPRNFL